MLAGFQIAYLTLHSRPRHQLSCREGCLEAVQVLQAGKVLQLRMHYVLGETEFIPGDPQAAPHRQQTP